MYNLENTSTNSNMQNNTQLVDSIPEYSELAEYPSTKIGFPTPYLQQTVITPSLDEPTLQELNHLNQVLQKNKQQYYQIGNAYDDTGAYCHNNPNCLSTTPLSIMEPASQNSIYKATVNPNMIGGRRDRREDRRRDRREDRRRDRREDRRKDRREDRRKDRPYDGPFGPQPIENDQKPCDEVYAHCEMIGRYGSCHSPKCRSCSDLKGFPLDYAGSGCVPRKKTGCYEYSGCPL